MELEKLEMRMYGFVPYNISPIQKGIQFGHAVQEYNNRFYNVFISEEIDRYDKLKFHKWRNHDKTFIILDGGTTNKVELGTLNNIMLDLKEAGIETAEFYEPDLGNQLTAVVFIVDERVFNKKKYPDFSLPGETMEDLFLINNIMATGKDVEELDSYKEWVEGIGGPKNLFLRKLLKGKKLA